MYNIYVEKCCAQHLSSAKLRYAAVQFVPLFMSTMHLYWSLKLFNLPKICNKIDAESRWRQDIFCSGFVQIFFIIVVNNSFYSEGQSLPDP